MAERLSHQEFEQRLQIPERVRREVLDRDNEQCQLCGTSGANRLQLHHVIYRSHGGRHDEENLVTLCWRCHADVHEGRQGVALIELAPGVLAAFPAQPRVHT